MTQKKSYTDISTFDDINNKHKFNMERVQLRRQPEKPDVATNLGDIIKYNTATAPADRAISGQFLLRCDAWLHRVLQLVHDATNRRMHNPDTAFAFNQTRRASTCVRRSGDG